MGLLNSLNNFFPTSFFQRYNRIANSYFIGSELPIWVDIDNLGEVYLENAILRLVIDRKALMYSNAKIEEVDKETGEVVVDSKAVSLLKEPNPLQAGTELLGQYMVLKSVYGNVFETGVRPSPSIQQVPETWWNLPSGNMILNPTGKMFEQTDIMGIVKNYEMKLSKGSKFFDPKEVVHKNDIANIEYLVSESRIKSLRKPISNIDGAYNTRNTVINKKGAIGILSPKTSKDGVGAMPMMPQERKRLEEEYSSKYGVGENQIGIKIAEQSMDWQTMSFPLKDLMVFEEVEADMNTIVDAYGLNMNIFSSTKGNTFENQREGLKGVYQNTIIPEAIDHMNSLSEHFGLTEKGTMLVATYDHLPIMQEDEKNKAETFKIKEEAFGSLLDRGIITNDEMKTFLKI